MTDSPMICSCAMPECLEKGCVRLRLRYQPSAPPPFWTEPALPSSVPPLTADDVRRIVREELARAAEQSDAADR